MKFPRVLLVCAMLLPSFGAFGYFVVFSESAWASELYLAAKVAMVALGIVGWRWGSLRFGSTLSEIRCSEERRLVKLVVATPSQLDFQKSEKPRIDDVYTWAKQAYKLEMVSPEMALHLLLLLLLEEDPKKNESAGLAMDALDLGQGNLVRLVLRRDDTGVWTLGQMRGRNEELMLEERLVFVHP